ncbi:MAG: AMP-binding protein [Acidimicrobiia bacterium]|nr:AMP-binding protein [Acidimicrobiia bacterium]
MDWLHTSASCFPNDPALSWGGEVVTYAALQAAADGVAADLAASGVAPGDRVALWGEGTPAAVAALWGIPRAGAVAVLLSPRLPPTTVMQLAEATGVRAVWGRGPGLDLPRSRRRYRLPPPGRGGPPDPEARFVVFTSGTSGGGRPVVLTGANLAAAAAASQARLGNGRGDRWLCVLPLYHVGGLSILWRSAREGGEVVLEPSFEAGGAADLLASGRIAFASLVPTMLRRILEQCPGPFPGVRGVLVGGGPSDPGLLEAARRVGLPALQTYGMTETASQVATEAPDEAGRRPGSAGRPLDGFEVRAVGDSGRVQPPEVEGRLEVRGPAVSPGYLGEAERSQEAWHRTGDSGWLDADGYLFVAGRADAVIVTGGENVHPEEVEAVLREYPGVADARVFGEPDPEWGRRVVAEIASTGQLDLAGLEAFARSRLASHQVPKRWRVVDSLARSEMGKPLLPEQSKGPPG